MALTKLNNQSLTNVTSAVLPSGALINTAQHYHQMTATQTQTSDAYADVTGSSFSYTPVSSSSTIILDFGSDKTSTAGDFTIVFPAAAASTAIIRIA